MWPDIEARAQVISQPVYRQSSANGASPSETELSQSAIQLVALLLAAIAILVHAIIAADGKYGLTFYLWLTVQLLIVVLGAWAFRSRVKRLGPKLYISPLLVLAGVTALIWEWGARQLLGSGSPFEIVAMTVLRNLVLGLAVFSALQSHQRLLVVLSLFLAMFGVTTGHDIATQWLAGLFSLTAMIWLMASHWEHVRRGLLRKEQSRWPRWAIYLPLLVLVISVITFASAGRSLTSAISGFVPSSGGTGSADPFAQGGVGDGEMLVAGTDRVQSFAPIEDAPFLQDDRPSLYDMFDDTYEEELKVTNSDRAIALPPEQSQRVREHLHSQVEKANREFSTLRQPREKKQHRHVGDIQSDAVLYVAGRVPLHLRLQVYDLFDGTTWYPQEPPAWQQPLKIGFSYGKPWLLLLDRGKSRDYLGSAETHALKIIRLESSVIPAPLFLHGVHIDLVDRADMYKHGPDGLVGLARREIPSLVPIHLVSRPINWKALDVEPRMFMQLRSEVSFASIPGTVNRQELQRLAEEWCRGSAPGWAQIQAIRNQLRTQYILAPDWRPAPAELSSVEQFLFESKQGPDYQFATAAALLLRSLGYQTRVVSGFYVRPERFDQISQHTPVLSEDVHFWTEVRMIGGDWITLEATPGYELLGPPPGFWERLWNNLAWSIAACLRNWLVIAIILLVLLFGRWQQRFLTDLLLTAHCKIAIWWNPAETIRLTLQLLKARAQLAGQPAERSVTHHQWLGKLLTRVSDRELAQLLSQLQRNVDELAYGRDFPKLTPAAQVCSRIIIRMCSLKWFQQQFEPTGQETEEHTFHRLAETH